MIYQSLAQCLLDRTLEDQTFNNGFLTSIMQVPLTPCDIYQCSETIPFFGAYEDYYVDELFDSSTSITAYEVFDLVDLDNVPFGSLFFDQCDEIETSGVFSKSLHSFSVKPIDVDDETIFTSNFNISNNTSISNRSLRLSYNPNACGHLTGHLVLSGSTKNTFYHLGQLHEDIAPLLEEGFSLSYYFENEQLCIAINQELVKCININQTTIDNPKSWIYHNLTAPLNDNCDFF